MEQGNIAAILQPDSWRHVGVRWLSLGSAVQEGELGFGPTHLLVRAVAVLLDWTCADEHIGAAMRIKTGAEGHLVAKHTDPTLLPLEIHLAASARCHSVPEQAGAQSRPPATHRSNQGDLRH